MTDQAQEAHGHFGRRRRILAALLALAIVIPLGALFLGYHRDLGERRSVAAQERHGIEYLVALGEITIALTDAQSAAVRGGPVAQEALDEAMADVADVDARFGAELRVRERWSQLRDTIELAAGTAHADGRAAYAAYEEATGQLLGLHDRLRETAGLVRDPDADAYHLQDAAAGQLPATIVAAGQLVDLLALTAGEPAGEPGAQAGAQGAQPTELPVAAAAVAGPADALVAGVQAALDSTASRSLSSAVLSTYDRFLRAKDGLLAAVPPEGDVEDLDPELLAAIRGEMRAAGDDLYTTLLAELDRLIGNRAGDLARSQGIAVAAGSAGVLLALGVAAVSLVRGVRPARRTPSHTDQPAGEPRPGQLTAGGGGSEPGGGSGSGHGRELSRSHTSISDAAAGSGSRPGTPPVGDRLAGQLRGSE